jgi:putative tryptophan/tyrosine transport system substrate-binding protein
MRRREFIALVGSALAAWPLTAFGKAQRIAIVYSFPVSKTTETSDNPGLQAFFSELRRLGYVEGQSLIIERHSGEGRAAHYEDLAREVVSGNPDMIVTIGTNELTLDFKAATSTIPIIGAFGAPVEFGIVASLARPGGNITGVTVDVGPEQWGKRVQMLRQVLPQATRLGFLNSRETREQWADYGHEIEKRMGIAIVGPPLNYPIDEAEYRRVFAALVQDRAEGLLVSAEDVNVSNVKLILDLTEKSRLPAIYPFNGFVQSGGLMSYGVDLADLGRRLANVAGQILKGTKPGDIPILQPTKFELAINLKTAKALGLTVPPELLATADVVIE